MSQFEELRPEDLEAVVGGINCTPEENARLDSYRETYEKTYQAYKNGQASYAQVRKAYNAWYSYSQGLAEKYNS